MPDAEPYGLDLPAVADRLRSEGIGVSGTLRAERVGLGRSNLTFLLTDERGGRWVARRPPLGRLLDSAHDVAREARILAALDGTDVPVPTVHAVTEDGGAPLVLMSYVDGVVLDRAPVAEAVPPSRRRAIGLSLAAALARVHAVDLDKTGLVDLASHRPYAARQLKRWSAQWERSRTRDLPRLDALTARLREAAPPQHELTLVHGDLHLLNVITSGETGEVAAVLDWELCTLGDPLADLGTLLAYWPEPGEPTGEFAASSLPGFPSRDEMVAAYLDRTGRDPAALGFWHALGLWKIAIIGEGVRRRALDEPRNRAADGTPTAARIESLVARADDVATAAGI